ncbi:hypothetical protein AVEN_270818-1 [Araneus ventricosus]|uniref:Uncharacterized protein n=1 Tax=Araneus ventricosus TaxID=182803 RepID=A0A4Y2JQX7_ARAVE|nr:hypothetical protein AVEN_270818-1 [Araneus ventricosus]
MGCCYSDPRIEMLLAVIQQCRGLANRTTTRGTKVRDVDKDARRKGVDGFSVETPGLLTDPVPISPSSHSMTNAWAPTVHKLCHNQAFCGLCDAQFLCLSTVQQQFHAW